MFAPCSYAPPGLAYMGPVTQGSALRLHPGLNSYAASRLCEFGIGVGWQSMPQYAVPAQQHDVTPRAYCAFTKSTQLGVGISSVRPVGVRRPVA
jgi:hypothetical protein